MQIDGYMVLMMLPFVGISVAVLGTVPRYLPTDWRFPFWAYIICYCVTFLLGAILIGCSNNDILEQWYFRAPIVLPDLRIRALNYWYLAFGPLIIPPIVVGFMARLNRPARNSKIHFPVLTPTAWILAYGTLLFQAYGAAYEYLQAVPTISTQDESGDSAATLIFLRLNAFDTIADSAFGIIYTAMPALCHVAIAMSCTTKRITWKILAILGSALCILLNFATFQGSTAMVFMVSICASLALHDKLPRLRSLTGTSIIVTGAVIGFIYLAIRGGDADPVRLALSAILRMPAALPVYLEYYQTDVMQTGLTVLGDFLGDFDLEPSHAQDIQQIMFLGYIQGGAMPAPAHINAYADFGNMTCLGYLLASGVMIAFVCTIFSRLRHHAIGHALAIQGLALLYYLSQVSVRGALWQSYGFKWSMESLAMLCLFCLIVSRVTNCFMARSSQKELLRNNS
jgi:hypothetical protein